MTTTKCTTKTLAVVRLVLSREGPFRLPTQQLSIY